MVQAWQWWIHLPWHEWLENSAKLAEILAALGAAIFAYLGLIKGKYRARLETGITASVFRRDGQDYLHVSVSAKNIGIWSLSIDHSNTTLDVFSLPMSGPISPGRVLSISDSDWTWQATLSIFDQDAWIDPSEDAQDELLLILPPDQVAVKVVAHIFGSGFDWGYTKIITIDPPTPRLVAGVAT